VDTGRDVRVQAGGVLMRRARTGDHGRSGHGDYGIRPHGRNGGTAPFETCDNTLRLRRNWGGHYGISGRSKCRHSDQGGTVSSSRGATGNEKLMATDETDEHG